VGQSHKLSGSEVDRNAFHRAASAGCERRKACPAPECNRVRYPVDDATVVLLDWS
jgi:hypothetical protein